MKLNSARAAWHDALYTPWDSQGAHVEQIGLLGCSVQKTEKLVNARHAAHQALSARIQHAIATLSPRLKAFGNFMYSPLTSIDDKEAAEELVLYTAYAMGPKMMAKKFARARYVAMAVLFRYRRMHQGGQSEGTDPLPTPEAFRWWISEEYDVKLSSEQWTREWSGFVELCFAACNDLDKEALAPIARSINLMKEAA